MRITVIGASSVDIYVRSKHQIVQGEHNPAEINLRAGGEARNISSMLARSGADVSLITAVGDDALGALLKDSCEGIGINTSAWIVKRNMNTCVNLETFDSNGIMNTGFSAMTVPEAIRTGDITKHKDLIKEADLLILDLNLTTKIIGVILELRSNSPVLVDAVSAQKAKRIEGMLEHVDILKLNRRQAESLTGIPLDSKERVKHACYSLVDRGARRVFVTLGIAGVCAADENSTIFVPTHPVAVRNVAGAGAAFVTGLAMGMDLDLRSQAEKGVSFAQRHLETYTKGKRITKERAKEYE